MTRSPLAYPLNRTADVDGGGGAADLQTDIMRFMAILSLCLVAIFALVQSIPLTPVDAPTSPVVPAPPVPEKVDVIEAPLPAVDQSAIAEVVADPVPAAAIKPQARLDAEKITLTRPKWVPKSIPAAAPPMPVVAPPARQETATDTEPKGFTLRFESDAALMRAVAASKVGLYAIDAGRAKRMTVSDSRISFWDASTPNAFHEMERTTVPATVVDALTRTGAVGQNVSWGVTLPRRMKSQLDALMQSHSGGSLIIGASGDIYREDL
jgi:hypothetical protein